MNCHRKGPIIASARWPYYVKNEWPWKNHFMKDELRRSIKHLVLSKLPSEIALV